MHKIVASSLGNNLAGQQDSIQSHASRPKPGSRPLLLLEIVSFLSIAYHLLLTSIGLSFLRHDAATSHSPPRSGSTHELVVANATGVLVNMLVIVGLWHHYRGLLLPQIIFSFLDLMLDGVYVIAFSITEDDELPGASHPLRVIVQISSNQTLNAIFVTFLSLKIFGSMVIIHLVLHVFQLYKPYTSGSSKSKRAYEGDSSISRHQAQFGNEGFGDVSMSKSKLLLA